jgi:hypothetical protein
MTQEDQDRIDYLKWKAQQAAVKVDQVTVSKGSGVVNRIGGAIKGMFGSTGGSILERAMPTGGVRHPDSIITKNPTMRSRYVGRSLTHQIDLSTVHDMKRPDTAAMNFDRLKAMSVPRKVRR